MKPSMLLVVIPLLLHLGACTATPITLPGGEKDGLWNGNLRDAGTSDSTAMADQDPTGGDLPHNQPDLGLLTDVSIPDGAAMDGLTDGACLECPQPDSSPGDSGPGPSPDTLNDLTAPDIVGGG